MIIDCPVYFESGGLFRLTFVVDSKFVLVLVRHAAKL